MLKDIGQLLIEKKSFFVQLTIEHLEISLLAILIAIVLGGVIGILISEFAKTTKPTMAAINFIYTIPSISMLGFLIPFLGIGNTTSVIALTIYALLPMVRNTYTGLVNVDKNIIEAARGMGSTNLQVLFKVKLPLAMPVIISGIRNMVIMTIALAGIASFVGAGGLGVAIYRGITTNNAAMTMAGSLLIALLALFLDFILSVVEKSKKSRHIVSICIGIVCVAIIGNLVISTGTKDTIHIATKPMTEQYIMGEMLDILIEKDTDLNVEVTQGVGGGTSNIQPAMEKGEFDIYPEYTGTAWNIVLKNSDVYDESKFDKMQNEYEKNLNMKWLGMYGFNNTYGMVVRKDIAEKYNLKTYSDLKNVSNQLTFGAEYDFFEREDGYESLCKTYGLDFAATKDMDIGLKYKAIEQGEIDVMPIFTTDGQLSIANVVILEDDKSFYPSYLCGNIVRKETLEKHPELEVVFEKLIDSISDSEMAEMNYKVESKGKEPREVAKSFLKSKGLI